MIAEKQKEHTAYLTALNELFQAYLQNINKFPEVESENIIYSEIFENKMLLIRVIREGLPYTLFSKIKAITPFSEDDWSEYLSLSKKTLQRHRNDADYIFKPIHTEKIIELAEVANFGKQVFDSTEQFYLWLNTPSFSLGNLKPKELLKDSYGKELVMSELNRIEQGIFV